MTPEGNILIFDNGTHQITHMPPKKRDIAMVFQNYAFYPHMNVYKNLAFALKLWKMPKPEIKETVEKTADLLGIGDFLNRFPNQLAGGQKQRVALGRAIVRQPKVFLFDEPLSNLDAKLRVSMRAEILDIHQRLNNTSIYVTHDQLEAMTMGTRIIIMKDGVIQQNGPPQEIYNNPANKFVAGFIGSPAMNVMACTIREEAGNLIAVNKGMNLTIPAEKTAGLKACINQDVYLGLRPEHFSDLAGNATEADNSIFKAFVRLVEPLGSEQLIHLEAEDQRFIARIDPRSLRFKRSVSDQCLSVQRALRSAGPAGVQPRRRMAAGGCQERENSHRDRYLDQTTRIVEGLIDFATILVKR